MQPPALERWKTYQIMLATGACDLDYICEMEGMPSPPDPDEASSETDPADDPEMDPTTDDDPEMDPEADPSE